jgi:orotidine-5'-phosphate decarboxylase
LTEHVARRQSQLVLGLDPDPSTLWPDALQRQRRVVAGSGSPAVLAAQAVATHCRQVIAAVASECVAVKPQVACFERLGAPGWVALEEVVLAAREAGLLVIADAKRGDIDVTARAYAQAFLGETPTPFGSVPGVGADAMTVSPWLGADAIEPMLAIARDQARGLFVLVRNSNPGAADLQDLPLQPDGTVSDAAARLVHRIGSGSTGPLSDVGAVVGATAPGRLERLRELMPRTPMLLPGVGAQGARVEDLGAAFTIGPAGGLIPVSRGLVNAYRNCAGAPADAARREAARLREQAWALVSP